MAILACKSWWRKQTKKCGGCMPAKPLHNTKQYINCTINGDKLCPQPVRAYIKLSHPTAELSFQHHGVNPYPCYTWLSAEPCQAAKQFIQPLLLPYKYIYIYNSELLKCTATEFRTWAVLTVFSLYTKSEPLDK